VWFPSKRDKLRGKAKVRLQPVESLYELLTKIPAIDVSTWEGIRVRNIAT
jgi:hypothetical protein